MNCPKCHQVYQKDKNIPLLLIKCGHTLCHNCATTIFNGKSILCPECNSESLVSSVSTLPMNMALLSISPQPQFKSKFGIEPIVNCELHKKKLEAYCLNDFALLCIDCILVDGHKSHDINSIPEARDKEIEKLQQAFNTANKLESTLRSTLSELEAFKCEIHQRANEKKDCIASIFRDIIKIINERENLLKQGVTNILKKEENNLQKAEKDIREHLESIKLFKESITEIESESAYKLLSKARRRKELLTKANATPPSISFNINFGEIKKSDELTTLRKRLNPNVVQKRGQKVYNTAPSHKNRKTDKKAIKRTSDLTSPKVEHMSKGDHTKSGPLTKAKSGYKEENTPAVLIDLPAKEGPRVLCPGKLQTTNSLSIPKGNSEENASTRLKEERKKRKEELEVVSKITSEQNVKHKKIKNQQIDTSDMLIGYEPSIFFDNSMSPSLHDICFNHGECKKFDLDSLLNNKRQFIYVFCNLLFNFIAGYGETGLYSCERYDVQKDVWGEVKPLATFRSKFPAVYAADGYIYLIGGKYIVILFIRNRVGQN